jgi:ABC transport permease subunit
MISACQPRDAAAWQRGIFDMANPSHLPIFQLIRWIESLGNFVINGVAVFFDNLYMLINAFAAIPLFNSGQSYYLRLVVVQQLYFTAAQSIVLVTALGVVLGILTMLPLLAFGVDELELLASIINLVLFHQILPVIVTLIIIGRSGTAVTAELGDMQANMVMNTMLVMGIDPHRFIVLPRILGITISLLLLTFWANFAALLGAGVVTLFHAHIGLGSFVDACIRHVFFPDVLLTAFMIVIYGITISLIHCHFGFRSKTSADIARHLPRAFVHSFLACILITLIFAVVRYG